MAAQEGSVEVDLLAWPKSMKGFERPREMMRPKNVPSRLIPPRMRESESMAEAEAAAPRECPKIPSF